MSVRAERELADILHWTEVRWNLVQRERYEATLSERLSILATAPELGRPFGPERPGLMQARAGRHTIFYRVKIDELAVVSIMHGRQDHVARLTRRGDRRRRF